MRADRPIFAALAGIGFTAFVALALNFPAIPVEMLALLFLTPGGIVASVVSKMSWSDSPVPILFFNAVIYSAIAYVVFPRPKLQPARKTLVVAALVLLLACLACIPRFSPLWPQGMAELDEQENSLRNGLPIGSSLDSARVFFQQRGISPYEEKEENQRVVFQDNVTKLVAEPRELVLSTSIPTKAEQLPCGYRIDVYLVFDQNNVLNRQRIERFELCP